MKKGGRKGGREGGREEGEGGVVQAVSGKQGEIGGASGNNSALTTPQGSLRRAEYSLGGKNTGGCEKEIRAQSAKAKDKRSRPPRAEYWSFMLQEISPLCRGQIASNHDNSGVNPAIVVNG